MYSDVDFPQNNEIQKQEIWNNFRKSQESNVFPSLLATAKEQASTARGCPSETVACWRIPPTGTAYSYNPSVSSDKEFQIIAIIWTSRVKPINRDFFSVPSEYD